MLVTVPRLSGVTRYGNRAEREVVGGVASALTRRLRTTDRAVRLSEHEFLLVVPGVGEAEATELVRHVSADLEGLVDTYPFVPMGTVSAVTVTRQRPLPLDELRATVEWAAAAGLPVALLPS